MVLSGDGWTRESVFECGRCHQGVLQSGGSCVLILVSFWLDLALNIEDAGGRFLVCVSHAGVKLPVRYGGGGGQFRTTRIVHLLSGLMHPEMAPKAAFMTGSIFEACDDLLQTGDAYSAEEKHRAGAVVRIVLASVPLLVFANFLRML